MGPKERDGPKEKWATPGHTWDSSWYNPHWHGNTYGLEVDPWSAVEPVPYLCAVSLSSSCEDDRNPHQTLETTPSSPRGFGTSKLNAHQVSYLAASGRRQQRSPSREWIWLEKIERDHGLGSAECLAPESLAMNVPLMETEASRQGQTYHNADGGVIKNNGEEIVTMYSETGDQYRARYQITDVTRPLNSVSQVCDQGNNVLSTQTGGWIINQEIGRKTWFPREH